MHPTIAAAVLALGASAALAQQTTPAPTAPPGERKEPKTRMLEAGAALLQGKSPLGGFDIYLVGFHPMKDNPEHQVESHHYCRQMNEDFAQCALFDSSERTANLHGVEYIISEKVFATLPDGEKKFWHPHNGEILSGQLMAPGIPNAAEKALMRQKMNSYGKTWHLWNTGHHGQQNDSLPLGEPMLAWSFNREGEALPELVQQRDRKMRVDTDKTRGQRSDLRQFAKPQQGVDALKGKFNRPTRDIPGVREAQ